MHLLAAFQATRVYTDGPSEATREAWQRVLAIATELGNADYQARAIWGLIRLPPARVLSASWPAMTAPCTPGSCSAPGLIRRP
jgi:hypothetical protein